MHFTGVDFMLKYSDNNVFTMFYSFAKKSSFFLVILFTFTLSNLELIGKEPAQKEVETSEKIVTRSASETATFIVKLLSTKDWKEISKFVHPTRGVRFSTYAYVFTNRGVVLSQ